MTAQERRARRQAGYRDGLAGRPASSREAEYQASWRRGQERRAEIHADLHGEPPLPPGEYDLRGSVMVWLRLSVSPGGAAEISEVEVALRSFEPAPPGMSFRRDDSGGVDLTLEEQERAYRLANADGTVWALTVVPDDDERSRAAFTLGQ